MAPLLPRTLILGLLAGAIGAVALAWPDPATRIAAASRDLARFAIIALAVYQGFRILGALGLGAVKSALLTTLGALGLGMAVEVLEWLLGESISRVDLAMDVAACIAGLAASRVAMSGTARVRILNRAVALSVVCAAIVPFVLTVQSYAQRRANFPSLLDAARGADLRWLRGTPGSVQVGTVDAELAMHPGEPAFVVSLDRGKVPGLVMDEPYADWRGFSVLHVDLMNPGAMPLELVLTLDDRRGIELRDDHFIEVVRLTPRSRQVLRVELGAMRGVKSRRQFNLAEMDSVMLYSPQPVASTQLLVRRIWLE